MKAPTRFDAALTSLRRARRAIQNTVTIPGISGVVTTYGTAVASLERRYDEPNRRLAMLLGSSFPMWSL